MAANNPFQGHFSVGQGRKCKRNAPQNSSSNLNSNPAFNTPMLYSIVDGVLALAIFPSGLGYHLQLVDKDKNYIENTFCFTNKDTVEKIALFINEKNFIGLIRYLQGNANCPPANIIIEHIYSVMKSLIFIKTSVPIVDLCPDSYLHSLSGQFLSPPIQIPETKLELPPFSTFEEIAARGERERSALENPSRTVNAAEVCYSAVQVLSSGASGSPVYQGLKLSISTVKKDQPGNGATLKPL